MAFTVEDGTGIATANAYHDVDFFRAHHLDRGRTADVGTYPDLLVQGAIVRATDYVDQRFGHRFRGFRESKSQGLEWPRLSAFDDDDFLLSDVDEIPRKLKMAVAEYTLIILQIGELLPIPARPFAEISRTDGSVVSEVSGQVARRREKVGPIEEENWYHEQNTAVEDSNRGIQSNMVNDFHIPEYPVADLWLEELLVPEFPRLMGRGD